MNATNAAHPPVVIIDRQVAKTFFGSADPIGKRIRIAIGDQPWLQVVGVVGHVRHDGLDLDPRVQVYWNYLQQPQDRMVLIARTMQDPNAAAASILAEVRSLDPEQPVYEVRTMQDVVGRSVSRQWLTTLLADLFAVMALLLAGIGVYGVISYSMRQRLNEIGIRLALGADRGRIACLVLGHAGRIAGIGIALGLFGALLLGRVMKSLLFEIGAADFLSIALSVATTFAVVLVASYIPARQASALNPVQVLRCE